MTNFTILLVAKNQFKGKINDFLRDKKYRQIFAQFFQRWLVVCIKPESEMVNGFDGENFPSQGRKINNRQRALKHKKLYVIILSHEKKKSEIPAPYALLSNRNLKTNPFPSRPLPPGGPLLGSKKPTQTNTPPWNECCYTTIIVIMCEHNWKKKN